MITIDQRMQEIKDKLGKVSPGSTMQLIDHLMPLVEEVERLRKQNFERQQYYQEKYERTSYERSEF